jgi:hypothetical protein
MEQKVDVFPEFRNLRADRLDETIRELGARVVVHARTP